MAVYKIVYSEEEHKEFERITLEMLKNGYNCVQISEKLGISFASTSRIKKRLINERKNNSRGTKADRRRAKGKSKGTKCR